MIPTIVGRHDDSGNPGLFDSVIQAAWSFCLALRARGLGTCWTTAVLAKDPELKELLGIPDHMTEIAMLPVAWTKGTDFSPATRHDARTITYVDGFARIFERGPSDPIRLADGPGTVVETDIDAPVSAVWPIVTDVDFPARFSEEFLGATWDDGGPALGATFTGKNQHDAIGEWEVPCVVDAFEDQRLFGWCTSDRDDPGARWRFELESIAGATRLRFLVHLGPGPSGITMVIDSMPEKEGRILHRRLGEHHANMQRVVDGIKAAAESM